jgi:hypothetical protein
MLSVFEGMGKEREGREGVVGSGSGSAPGREGKPQVTRSCESITGVTRTVGAIRLSSSDVKKTKPTLK